VAYRLGVKKFDKLQQKAKEEKEQEEKEGDNTTKPINGIKQSKEPADAEEQTTKSSQEYAELMDKLSPQLRSMSTLDKFANVQMVDILVQGGACLYV
jgi:phage shock protein A